MTIIDWIHNHILLLASLAVILAIPQIVGVCLSRILLLQIKDSILFTNRLDQEGQVQRHPLTRAE